MALMDVLRLFDLNPEKIAAITADRVPAMTGKMNGMKGKKLKLENLVPDILSYLFYFIFYKPSLTTWKSLCAVYKIMNSKWRPGFTSSPSNYVNSICSPNMVPCHCIFKSNHFHEVECNTYDAYLWSHSYQTWEVASYSTSQWQKGILCCSSTSDLQSEKSRLKDKSATGQSAFSYPFSCVQRRLVSDFITTAVSYFQAPFKRPHAHSYTPSLTRNFLKLQLVICFESVCWCQCRPAISFPAPGQVLSVLWPLCPPHTVSVQ